MARYYRITPHHNADACRVVDMAQLRMAILRLDALDLARIECLQVGDAVDVGPRWPTWGGVSVTRLNDDQPRHVRPGDIKPGTKLADGRTVSAWRLSTTIGNRFNASDGETWTDGVIEYADGTTEAVVVMQGGRRG